MARKRKRVNAKKNRADVNSGFWRGFGAVLLIVAGIVTFFGAFINAPVPHWLWKESWNAFGVATIFVPPVLIYLGTLKFVSEEQRIPLTKLIGAFSILLFFSSWFYTLFAHHSDSSVALVGGHGGSVGKAVGNILISPLGKFLSSLVFFILAIFAVLFTFAIDPRSLAKLLQLFRREKPEGEEGEIENLADLKKKLNPDFQLHEGVPVEHHVPGRMPNLRNTAEKLSPAQEHAALTIAKDPDWKFPPLTLLNDKQDKADAGNVQDNAQTIKESFSNFNIDVEVEGANVGPRVTQYTIKPPAGVKLSRITALENNLALDLAADTIRMEAPIPGKRAVGIEVPNVKAATVSAFGILNSTEWQTAKSHLSIAVGKDISGSPIIGDLERMPHLLIAGQTGSGKSVMINALLTSLLYKNSPSDLKLILVDPKQVEMNLYKDIPHLLAPVIHEPEKCISALKWAVAEMERRLKAFAEEGKRNIGEYNALKKEEGMPYIVVVIDELADLMMMAARDVEALIVRIAQKARAAGIHLVIATQRPSVDVITGLIKANVPGRIAFTTISQIDSRTIIDQAGAEKLLGQGDMLYSIAEFPKPRRVQAALITDTETNKICDFLREQRPPTYDDEVVSQPVQIGKGGSAFGGGGGDDVDDSAWKDAVEVVIASGKASTSLLQRKLRIGYGRASRLIDMMEEQGIVGPASGSRPRDVLVQDISQVMGGGATAEAGEAPQSQTEEMYDENFPEERQ